MNINFEDLDDFDSIVTKPDSKHGHAKTEQYPCEKCAGKGVVSGGYVNPWQGKCYQCNGKGYFLTSKADRQKSRSNYQASKVKKAANHLDQFAQDNPELYTFLLESPWSSFCTDLLRSIKKYGDLTERQLSAAMAVMDKNKKRQCARDKAESERPTIELSGLFDLFNRAIQSGLKKPKLTIDGLGISLAPSTGNNSGHLYVKVDGDYAGKITPQGQLRVVRNHKNKEKEIADKLAELATDPLNFATLYGQRTGTCCCCNRELTDPISIENGIGPICAEKWGLS